jgi:hypothetical protein
METTKLADVVSVQEDVAAFIEAAEQVLSPALRTTAFTPDECDLIREYVMSLSHARPPVEQGSTDHIYVTSPLCRSSYYTPAFMESA